MLFLDFIKKPKQVNPVFENSFSHYNEPKNDPFVRVPLSPPMNRYTRYNKHKDHMTDLDLEKLENNKFMYKHAHSREKVASMGDKGEPCSRVLCCCCFPCFPLWGRALCCFIFLGIGLLLAFFALILSTFKAPQIKYIGSNYDVQNGVYTANYSLQNNNFFGFDFENIKIMAYYSGVVETVGVGEIPGLELYPQSAANVTVPMQIIIHGQKEDSDSNSSNTGHLGVFFSGCSSAIEGKETYRQKMIEIAFDAMPTIKILNYPIATVVFHGQKTKINCSEVLKNTSIIDVIH